MPNLTSAFIHHDAILGADLESVGSMNRENVTIAEDTNDSTSMRKSQGGMKTSMVSHIDILWC